MRGSQSSGPIHRGVGTTIVLMMGVVALTPLVLALAVRGTTSDLGSGLLAATALTWAVVFAIYRAFAATHQHRRRALLQLELANTRRARLEANAAFQDRLNDHYAVLDRIAEISEDLLKEGIVDPQLALHSVRQVEAHARAAQIQIEDAIIEVRVDAGVHEPSIETVNTRDQIEQVVAPFARTETSIATSGPRHFATTDAAILRLIVRSLVAGAVDRDANDVDVSVSRDSDLVILTVSDDGPDCSRLGLDAISPLARSLAPAAHSELRFLRALGRNQYSVAMPAADPPLSAGQPATPMDVLGDRAPSGGRIEVQLPPSPHLTPEEMVTFAEDQERDRQHSIAARRERGLLAR